MRSESWSGGDVSKLSVVASAPRLNVERCVAGCMSYWLLRAAWELERVARLYVKGRYTRTVWI